MKKSYHLYIDLSWGYDLLLDSAEWDVTRRHEPSDGNMHADEAMVYGFVYDTKKERTAAIRRFKEIGIKSDCFSTSTEVFDN